MIWNYMRTFFFLSLLIIMGFSMASSLTPEELEQEAISIVNSARVNFSFPEQYRTKVVLGTIRDNSASTLHIPLYGSIIWIDASKLMGISSLELQGLLAHELAHAKKYSEMNILSLTGYGIHYAFSSSFKRQVERETDMTAISHGFGKGLAAFRAYRLQIGNAHDVRLLEKYYMGVDEVKNLTRTA